MDKRSTHWADVLVWLEKVANSCESKEQALTCERLVWNFHRAYQDQLGFADCLKLTSDIDKILTPYLYPPFKKQK